MKTSEQEKLEKAKERVEKIKQFYFHLTIYAVINILLLLQATGVFSDGFFNLHMPHWGYFTTPFFWGLGVLFHGLYTFKHKAGFLKRWEERKIKEYLEKEEKDFENFNR